MPKQNRFWLILLLAAPLAIAVASLEKRHNPDSHSTKTTDITITQKIQDQKKKIPKSSKQIIASTKVNQPDNSNAPLLEIDRTAPRPQNERSQKTLAAAIINATTSNFEIGANGNRYEG